MRVLVFIATLFAAWMITTFLMALAGNIGPVEMLLTLVISVVIAVVVTKRYGGEGAKP